MNAATVLNGTVFLNAQNNPDAVFVIKIVGALSTSTYASVVLQNSAQAKNVFWKIDGATSLNDYASFRGTLIGNNGAVILNTGTTVEGRVLSTSGGISTFGINAQMTPGCGALGINDVIKAKAQFYPNPFTSSLNVTLADFDSGSSELTIYNALGMVVLKTSLTQSTTSIPMSLASGIYYYKLSGADGTLQSGKLISRQ